MGWQPKEKELTPQEAIKLAKNQLAPFWHGSDPQLIGIELENGAYSAFPLDPEFTKKPCFVFCIDLTDYSGESAFFICQEWYRRFHSLGLPFLIIVPPTYSFLTDQVFIKGMLEECGCPIPLVFDNNWELLEAFGTTTFPRVFLIEAGNRIFDYSEPEWIKKAELSTQHFLRSSDPGLSLLLPIQPSDDLLQTVIRIEFGFKPKIGNAFDFPKPGFKAIEGSSFLVGTFPKIDLAQSGQDFLSIEGNWIQDEERIVTSDPKAVIVLNSLSKNFAIVASSLSEEQAPPVISVEVQGLQPYDEIRGKHLVVSENAGTVLTIAQPGLYHALVNLPEKERHITLRFPFADKSPVALNGFRFGERF